MTVNSEAALHGVVDASCDNAHITAEWSDLPTKASLQWGEGTHALLNTTEVGALVSDHMSETTDAWDIASELASEGERQFPEPTSQIRPWIGREPHALWTKATGRAGSVLCEQLDVVEFDSVGTRRNKVSSGTWGIRDRSESWHCSPVPHNQCSACVHPFSGLDVELLLDEAQGSDSEASCLPDAVESSNALHTDTQLQITHAWLTNHAAVKECLGDVALETESNVSDEGSSVVIDEEEASRTDSEGEHNFSSWDSVLVIDNFLDETPCSVCHNPRIENEPEDQMSFAEPTAFGYRGLGTFLREQCLEQEMETDLGEVEIEIEIDLDEVESEVESEVEIEKREFREKGYTTGQRHQNSSCLRVSSRLQTLEHVTSKRFVASFQDGGRQATLSILPKQRQHVTPSGTTRIDRQRVQCRGATSASLRTLIDGRRRPSGALCVTLPSCWMEAVSGLWRSIALLTGGLC